LPVSAALRSAQWFFWAGSKLPPVSNEMTAASQSG
jgi:hypothetical protein